ncbi:MAG: hypothetical protein GX575_08255 [Candidatus Anammoximicrobium sp.]|nr:hypothetical protein [Candidatus Anammoximicrobium sp.]
MQAAQILVILYISQATAWTADAPAKESAVPAEELVWYDDFSDPSRWKPQPAWLANPSATAAIAGVAGVAEFCVDRPHQGMKWSRDLPPAALAETPWLAMRYRAKNLNQQHGDYAIYVRDGKAKRQLSPWMPGDLVADGAWHVAAVNVSELTDRPTVDQIAVQVQAGPAGAATLSLDWIGFSDVPPAGALILGRRDAVPCPADWVAPPSEAWTAQPSWLANPASPDSHHTTTAAGITRFRVTTPGRGMKWSWSLPAPVDPAGFRYAVMRFRARNLSPHGHYALCFLGKPLAGDVDYQVVLSTGELTADGRWHTVWASLGELAAKLAPVTGLACEVQAAASDAELEVAEIRLANRLPPQPLSEACSWRPGATFETFQSVPLPADARTDGDRWLQRLRLTDWPATERVTVEGIPFLLAARPRQLAATSIQDKSPLALAADCRGREVFLLLLAKFFGPDEPVFGGGRLKAISDVDRFRLQLQYDDGTADECLPWNISAGRFGVIEGAQVLAAAADGAKRLRQIVVCDGTRQGAFAVAACSARIAGERGFPQVLEDTPPLVHRPTVTTAFPPPQFKISGTHLHVASGGLAAEIAWDGLPSWRRLEQRASGWDLLPGPNPLVGLTVDGQAIVSASVQLRDLAATADSCTAEDAIDGAPGLTLTITVEAAGDGSLAAGAAVANQGLQPHRVTLIAPRLGPYRLSADALAAHYLVPKRGAAFDNRPCNYRERYCGLFPLQFLDTFSPADGRGLSLRTEDTDCAWKHYLLEKTGVDFSAGVEYAERMLAPGERFQTPRTVIQLTDGFWLRGFSAYRDWLQTFYQPAAPRLAWFREVFNFRQRFLHWLDPLYDGQQIHLQRAVDEAVREFGGIDYLHLFDWGNCGPHGRIYGRTGDYSPFDFLQGGQAALRDAIAGVQRQGVPVGLYIEGYLLDERGRLGGQFGKAWQLIDAAGRGARWPDSNEIDICSYVPAWREVQAATYAEKVRQLNVDGMYIDEYGFASSHFDCWSAEHGHARPGYAVIGERETTRAIRHRVGREKTGVAIYTEESPVDVVTQLQDGSFTYAMSTAGRTTTRVPLNVTRFALPSFKTIEILYCDKPTASWATGVKWVFFNGEAIWLEGPAAEWFEPETRAAIRRCYRLLREHRDAFTSDRPTPLFPTLLGGVYANAFPARDKTVYTLYNSRHRTVRGGLLSLPWNDGASCEDAWNGCPATVARQGERAVVTLELGPHDVGCLVARQKP